MRFAGLVFGLLLLPAALPAAALEAPRNEQDFNAMRTEAISLYQSKRYEEALARLALMSQAAPKIEAIWVMRGNAENFTGHPKEALASFEHAIAIDGKDHRAHTGRGLALFTLKRFDESAEALTRAAELRPDDRQILQLRAASLHYAGRDAQALEGLQRAVALDPKDAGSWRLQGVSLFRLGRYGEALESFDKAIALDPEPYDAWMSKGSCLVKLGRDEESIVAYDKAVRRNSLDPQVQYNRGVVLQRLGRVDEARKALKRAVALRPEDAAAKAALAALPGAPPPLSR
jgi:tetratricopeptide (TPR) repeat protein